MELDSISFELSENLFANKQTQTHRLTPHNGQREKLDLKTNGCIPKITNMILWYVLVTCVRMWPRVRLCILWFDQVAGRKVDVKWNKRTNEIRIYAQIWCVWKQTHKKTINSLNRKYYPPFSHSIQFQCIRLPSFVCTQWLAGWNGIHHIRIVQSLTVNKTERKMRWEIWVYAVHVSEWERNWKCLHLEFSSFHTHILSFYFWKAF